MIELIPRTDLLYHLLLSVAPNPGVCLSKNINTVSAPCKFSNLRIAYTLCRSLRKKLVEFGHSIIEKEANLVAVAETWFSSGNEMNIPVTMGIRVQGTTVKVVE